MEFLQKYRTALLPAAVILFLLLFAFYMLGVRPAVNEAAEGESQIRQLEETQTLLQSRVTQLESNTAKGTQAEELRKILPESEDTEQLIHDFTELSRTSLVLMQDVQFSLPDRSSQSSEGKGLQAAFPEVREVKMSAQLEGDAEHIRSWMEELQKLKRLTAIDSFSYQKPYESAGAGSIIKANVTFTAYYDPA